MENVCYKRGLCLILVSKEILWRLLHVIVITFLYLCVHVNFSFQVHQGHVRNGIGLVTFCF
jgi:hypothetical protein